MIAVGVTTGASLLVVTDRIARYYEADIPPSSLMHGLWVQSTEWYSRPFPEEIGICQVVEVIQTVIIKIAGDIIGGIAFLLFLVERVWHMVFGPSESDLLQQEIAKQQAELEKLAGVQALSAQLLKALGQAVSQSEELAKAVQDILGVKPEDEAAEAPQVTIEQTLAMIGKVLDAVLARAEAIASDPERGVKMERFKKALQDKAEDIAEDIVLVGNMGNEMEDVVAEREEAADGLERVRGKVDTSLNWMVRSLVEILVPKPDLPGGSYDGFRVGEVPSS